MEQDTSQQASGRSFTAFVYGDTANEMELAALDQARAFFGETVQLTIVKDYGVGSAQGHPGADGKRYCGAVRVEVTEDAS
jgi:hypothetical protein